MGNIPKMNVNIRHEFNLSDIYWSFKYACCSVWPKMKWELSKNVRCCQNDVKVAAHWSSLKQHFLVLASHIEFPVNSVGYTRIVLSWNVIWNLYSFQLNQSLVFSKPPWSQCTWSTWPGLPWPTTLVSLPFNTVTIHVVGYEKGII